MGIPTNRDATPLMVEFERTLIQSQNDPRALRNDFLDRKSVV
jgi:hypothetical protein